MSLLQPFPVAPVAGRKHADPGFEVQFVRGASRMEDTVIADLQSEILTHAHAIIEARVDQNGRAEWRMIKNRFGDHRIWTPIHHEGREASIPYYEHLRDVAMKAHYFILSPDLLPGLAYTRIRELLGERGGIRFTGMDFG